MDDDDVEMFDNLCERERDVHSFGVNKSRDPEYSGSNIAQFRRDNPLPTTDLFHYKSTRQMVEFAIDSYLDPESDLGPFSKAEISRQSGIARPNINQDGQLDLLCEVGIFLIDTTYKDDRYLINKESDALHALIQLNDILLEAFASDFPTVEQE